MLFNLLILRQMGIISVSSQQLEPTQVNCQVNNSEYLGLIQGFSTSLNQVIVASLRNGII
ncbi:MAG: hypothetical protein QNJ74_12205 [Trichodesmium sp. MO_231.B1]|nr:hypothetical protein [Trichodesmium sp. MO_231.B1]